MTSSSGDEGTGTNDGLNGAASSLPLSSLPEGALRRIIRIRRIALPTLAVSSLALIPWSVYLALTLPHHYDASRWQLTWTGFDIALAVLLGVTAYLAWRKRLVAGLTATASGTMLWVDAWFDVTSASSQDIHSSLLVACIEIPLGAVLLTFAWMLFRRVRGALGDLRAPAELELALKLDSQAADELPPMAPEHP